MELRVFWILCHAERSLHKTNEGFWTQNGHVSVGEVRTGYSVWAHADALQQIHERELSAPGRKHGAQLQSAPGYVISHNHLFYSKFIKEMLYELIGQIVINHCEYNSY